MKYGAFHKANRAQCKVLRAMLNDHNNLVLSSYMRGDNMVIETEDNEKCFVLPNGTKHPKLYYIEQSCLKCDACEHTGWRKVDIATSKDQAKQMKKHWQHYFGNEGKVRINTNKGVNQRGGLKK